MIKILTAIGNPKLNNELSKYSEFKILGKDIQYMDGIIELLELNTDINYLIISEILCGNYSLEELIEKIYKINRKIKIIIILENKNIELEDKLLKFGVYDILYDKSDINEIINLLKSKNIEYLNKELREEIDNLKEIIIENNKIKNNKIKRKKFTKIYKKNNEINNLPGKIIAIAGTEDTEKSIFSAMISTILSKKYKILLIDFNLINSNIYIIFNKNKYPKNIKKINEYSLKDFIIKINNNLDIITGLDYIFKNKKKFEKNIIEQMQELKKIYNYIFINFYSEKIIKENRTLLNNCDNIFLLTGVNNLKIKKIKNQLYNINKKYMINNKKIKLILYNYNKIDLIFYNKFNIKNIFKDIDIIGKIKYSIFCDFYINNNFKNSNINFILRNKIYKIIEKIKN